MKQRYTTLTAGLILVLTLVASGTQAMDYSSLLKAKARGLLPVKFTVKMTVSRQGKSNTRTISGRANGTLINRDGLVLVSARQLKGPAMFNQSGRRGMSIETVAQNFKTRAPDGTWLKTELAARDSGLDLAFLTVKKSLKKYKKLNPVSLPEEDQSLTVGDKVTHISRFPEGLNFEPHLLVTRISGTISEPRLRYSLMDGTGMLANYIGSPGFDVKGNFVGMATFRSSQGSGGTRGGGANPFTNMSRNQQFLLPAAKIRKAVNDFQSGQ